MLAPIVAIFMVILSIIEFIRSRTDLGYPTRKYFVNIFVCICLIIFLLIPSFTYLPIKLKCGTANVQRVQEISQSMTIYKTDKGYFPKDLDTLVPEYLSDVPSPACNFMSGLHRSFQLRVCNEEEPLFYVRSVDLLGFYFYSFGDGRFSSLWSFLDNPDPGACYDD